MTNKALAAAVAAQSKADNAAIEAAALATSVPYTALARGIFAAMNTSKALTNAAADGKKGLWAGFKRALSIAAESGHSASTLRSGLAIACEEAGIPSGSYRGYISTLASLYESVQNGEMEMEVAQDISVKDARDLYRAADPQKEARAAIAERIKDWTVEELGLLTLLLDEVKAVPEPEVVTATIVEDEAVAA